jgi:hypothetical protein
VLRVLHILADCALDPRHPNAPCNDTPGPPWFAEPLFIIGVLLLIVLVAGLVMLLQRRDAGGAMRSSEPRSSWPFGPKGPAR